MVTNLHSDSAEYDPIPYELGHIVTAEEFFLLSPDIGRAELIAGKVQTMSPAGYGHGRVLVRLGRILDTYAEESQLGEVCVGDVGFILARNPDTVLAPDLAFVRRDRLPSEDLLKFVEGPPDLVVEVASPRDRKAALEKKAQAWLDAGAAMVWVVDQRTKTVSVYRAGAEMETLDATQTLEGKDVVPGFECPVARIFPKR